MPVFLFPMSNHIYGTTSSSTITENPLFLTEADEDLQIHENSELEKVLFEFNSKGGTCIRINTDNPTMKAILLPGDEVYPACSAGFYRSQTLWALLKKYEDKIMLIRPHATRYGFDPYNEQVNWHRKHNNIPIDEFELWFSIPKAIRIGFDIFGDLSEETIVSPEKLNEIKEYYDKAYYGPQSGSRRVYMSFDKNTHVILYRLNQTNENLDNVIVYHFPLQDLVTNPLVEWNILSRSDQAYRQFSRILLELLDFSQL